MRLTSEPKPIKIRIVSGGEEHSSLDSLLHCFCVSDLQKVDKQLLQWLMRQGEQGIKIADKLEKFPDWTNASAVEDYFRIYGAFFPKLIEENKIDSLYQLLTFWYDKPEFKKNVDYLVHLSFGKENAITLFCYKHEIEGLTNDWIEVLSEIPFAKDIVDDLIKKKVLASRTRFYPDLDSRERMRRVTDYWCYGGTLDLFDMKDENARQRNLELKVFINNSKSVCSQKSFPKIHSKMLPEVRDADFENRSCFYKFMEGDFLFCAKVFILLLFEIHEKWDHLRQWRKELVNCYPPAAFMVNQADCPSLRATNFKMKSFAQQVENFVCYHLFEY